MELEQLLNEFLADLNVFYRKLQNYHWNVEGKDFFVIHSKLEEYYDEIAEHILILGGQPLGTMKDYLEITSIVEAEDKKIKSDAIFHNLVNDFSMLLKKVTEIKEEAENQKEYTTSSLMDEYMESYSKKVWMLKQSME